MKYTAHRTPQSTNQSICSAMTPPPQSSVFRAYLVRRKTSITARVAVDDDERDEGAQHVPRGDGAGDRVLPSSAGRRRSRAAARSPPGSSPARWRDTGRTMATAMIQRNHRCVSAVFRPGEDERDEGRSSTKRKPRPTMSAEGEEGHQHGRALVGAGNRSVPSPSRWGRGRRGSSGRRGCRGPR